MYILVEGVIMLLDVTDNILLIFRKNGWIQNGKY